MLINMQSLNLALIYLKRGCLKGLAESFHRDNVFIMGKVKHVAASDMLHELLLKWYIIFSSPEL